MNNLQFFRFKVQNESKTWTVPNTTTEGTDTLRFMSNWTNTSVQGSTEAMSAFNYVQNPTININLKFHEDLWREFNLTDSYEKLIAKFASLQYPGGTSTITAPYIIISFNGFIFRGYFTSVSITQTGPLRNGYRPQCEIVAQFTIVKSSSPTKTGIENSLKTHFQ